MLSSVAVFAYEGVSTFGLGVTAEVFGCDRKGEGIPRYEYFVTAAEPGVIRTDVGIPILVESGLERLSSADLAVVVCWDDIDTRPPEPVLAALRAVVDRGGRVLSQCTGAFVLAAAGLLDGRRATTHWKYAAELARRYPQVEVDPGVLYVDEGRVITSAGTAAGIDACLHVIRLEHGAAVPTRSPATWWSPRTVTAGRRSSSRYWWTTRRTDLTWPRCVTGRSGTCTSRLPSPTSPGRCTWRRARSPAGSPRAPGRLPISG